MARLSKSQVACRRCGHFNEARKTLCTQCSSRLGGHGSAKTNVKTVKATGIGGDFAQFGVSSQDNEMLCADLFTLGQELEAHAAQKHTRDPINLRKALLVGTLFICTTVGGAVALKNTIRHELPQVAQLGEVRDGGEQEALKRLNSALETQPSINTFVVRWSESGIGAENDVYRIEFRRDAETLELSRPEIPTSTPKTYSSVTPQHVGILVQRQAKIADLKRLGVSVSGEPGQLPETRGCLGSTGSGD